MANEALHRQDRLTPSTNRPPEHLSATDEDSPSRQIDDLRSSPPPDAPFAVFTPNGFQPFYPPQPEPIQSSELLPDNPFNPHGQPSLSLPQQATPLTSQQGTLTIEQMADPQQRANIAATQDGLAPDDPTNPRGTPDYIVEDHLDTNRPGEDHPLPPPVEPPPPGDARHGR
jgi:hypothetical protein